MVYRDKNRKKGVFTAKLFSDVGAFQDARWPHSVEEKYMKSNKRNYVWMIRSKADTYHGGGVVGHQVAQGCIDMGIYESKVTEGKTERRSRSNGFVTQNLLKKRVRNWS